MKVGPADTLRDGDQLPQASIKINGNFDDWKGILPALSSAGSDEQGKLGIDKVYLAVDAPTSSSSFWHPGEKNLYMRFEIKSPLSTSFWHQEQSFDADHLASYGLDLETGTKHVTAEFRLWGARWGTVICRVISGHQEEIYRNYGNLAIKDTSIEASFPLAPIRKELGDLPNGGSCKVTARTGYYDKQGKWFDGDKTETKQFAF